MYAMPSPAVSRADLQRRNPSDLDPLMLKIAWPTRQLTRPSRRHPLQMHPHFRQSL